MSPWGGPPRFAILSLALWALTDCDLFAGRGGGTETESSVIGVALNPDRSPVSGARVVVHSSDYLADSLSGADGDSTQFRATVTDKRGRFSIKGLLPGFYRAEVAKGSNGLVLDFELQTVRQKMVLAPDTLRATGSISGTFTPDSGLPEDRFVQVFGMARLVKADGAGRFKVHDLPQGLYNLRFLSLAPFRKSALRGSVEVRAGADTLLEPIVLDSEAKLTFSDSTGALEIDGVGPDNPLILDNELWIDGVENEYIWAKASAGRLDLRGNIVTEASKGAAFWQRELQNSLGELRVAHLAGMRNIPVPVVGATRRLMPAASGRLEDIVPEHSSGSELIVAEARKASPERPLIVVIGGPPTTVANAYLADPSIAPNLVVIGAFSFNINNGDTLANYLVSKKCRTIHWGRDYTWGGKLNTANLARLPGSWMGRKLNAYLSARQGPGLPFGDLGPAAYLFHKSVWKKADMARVAQPLTVTPASHLAFDFLDIPLAVNDWDGFEEEFFTTMADSLSFNPQILPGRLEAEAFDSISGATLAAVFPTLDSAYGFDAVAGIRSGAWLDFSVLPTAEGMVTIIVQYRSPQGGKLSLGRPGAPFTTIDLPVSVGWSQASASISIPTVARAKWRVSAVQGAFDLDWVEIR